MIMVPTPTFWVYLRSKKTTEQRLFLTGGAGSTRFRTIANSMSTGWTFADLDAPDKTFPDLDRGASAFCRGPKTSTILWKRPLCLRRSAL